IKGYDHKKVRIGMIGAGGRGTSPVRGLLKRGDVEISNVCDVRKEHAERAKRLIVKTGKDAPDCILGRVLQRPAEFAERCLADTDRNCCLECDWSAFGSIYYPGRSICRIPGFYAWQLVA